MDEPAPTQRIDRWLWHARFTKTRSLAQKLVASGGVRVDRQRITSPSYKLRRGHVLTLAMRSSVRIIEVRDFAVRRGPFSLASKLYADLTPPVQPTGQANSETSDKPALERLPRPDREARRIAIRLKQNFPDQ